MPDPAASALAKKRWDKLTPAERKAQTAPALAARLENARRRREAAGAQSRGGAA